MPFQPGNQEAKKADHRKRRVVTQQLTSALNEAYDEGRTKLRAVIDAWVANAIKGDQGSITALADRLDGKPAQAIVGDDESPLNVLHRIERVIVDKATDTDSPDIPPAA